MKLAPKKVLIYIAILCGIIALLILLGLAYGKRRWQESCVSGNELFRSEQSAQTCELQYVKSRK
jgi:hypothetical protein